MSQLEIDGLREWVLSRLQSAGECEVRAYSDVMRSPDAIPAYRDAQRELAYWRAIRRLVDAPPSERVPEVPNGALDWLYGQQAKYKQSVVLAGIVAAVEYCAAQNRRPDARMP